MKISFLQSLNTFILGFILFLLSIKGGNVIVLDDVLEITISLPSLLVFLKSFIYEIVAFLIGFFMLISLKLDAKVKYSLAIVSYLIIMVYYFVASIIWGSGEIQNMGAIVIILGLTPGILKMATFQDKAGVIKGFLDVLNIFAISFILINIFLYLFGYGYPETSLSSKRFFGSTSHPNAVGALAAICSGILIYQVLSTVGYKRIIFFIFLLCSVFLTVISGSRAALLTLIIAVLLSIRSFKLFIYIVAISFIFITLAIISSDVDSNIYLAVDRMIYTTTDNRNEVWQLLLNDFYENFLTGVGDRTAVSGSVYLTAFAGTGILGGLLFMLVVFLTIKQAIINIIRSVRNDKRNLDFVISVVVLQILVGGLFEAAVFDRLSAISLITLICIVIINSKRGKTIAQTQK